MHVCLLRWGRGIWWYIYHENNLSGNVARAFQQSKDNQPIVESQ